MTLTKTEKKIRIRTAKREKTIKKKYIPQTPFIKRLLDIWLQIERIWLKNV